MKTSILIIGSTGKLGRKLLNFCHKNNVDIFAITCFKNKNLLFKQKEKYKIKNSFVLSDYNEKELFLNFIKIKSLNLIYFLDYGSSSILYLNQIINFQINCNIAIANKEMIIAGGNFFISKIKNSKNFYTPLDSEHFSLVNNSFDNKNIHKIYITASGGPFYFKKNIDLNEVTKNEVLAHPKWKMGVNNLIDSSNFINKLLEIFELSILFNIELSKIDFVVSPNAYLHSIIHYKNGIISFNCYQNDMLIPLIAPLKDYFNLNYKINNFDYDQSKFYFEKPLDKRFKIFDYFKKFKNMNHPEQIHFLIINNYAQELYLKGFLKYSKIPYFINQKLKCYNFKNLKLNSFNKINRHIYLLNKKYGLSDA